MNENDPLFSVGDIVRVRISVNDPDVNNHIGGWCGNIEDIIDVEKGDHLYRIVWDKATLLGMSSKHLKHYDRRNLDLRCMILD